MTRLRPGDAHDRCRSASKGGRLDARVGIEHDELGHTECGDELGGQETDAAASDDGHTIVGCRHAEEHGFGRARGRFETRGGAEIAVSWEHVDQLGRQQQMVGPGPWSGEAGLLVGAGAQRRVAAPAGDAAPTRAEALADDGLSHQRQVDVAADGLDHAGPLVSGDDRIADEPVGSRAGEQVTVRAADAGVGDPHLHLTSTWLGRFDRADGELARSFDDDRSLSHFVPLRCQFSAKRSKCAPVLGRDSMKATSSSTPSPGPVGSSK